MTVYAEIGHNVGEIDFEIQAVTVGTVSFIEVAFTFRVGIAESYQEVWSLSNVPSKNGGALKAVITIDRDHRLAVFTRPFLEVEAWELLQNT